MKYGQMNNQLFDKGIFFSTNNAQLKALAGAEGGVAVISNCHLL